MIALREADRIPDHVRKVLRQLVAAHRAVSDSDDDRLPGVDGQCDPVSVGCEKSRRGGDGRPFVAVDERVILRETETDARSQLGKRTVVARLNRKHCRFQKAFVPHTGLPSMSGEHSVVDGSNTFHIWEGNVCEPHFARRDKRSGWRSIKSAPSATKRARACSGVSFGESEVFPTVDATGVRSGVLGSEAMSGLYDATRTLARERRQKFSLVADLQRFLPWRDAPARPLPG